MERSDSLIRFVSIVVFAAMVIYMISTYYAHNVTLQTMEAVGIELRDNIETEGYVIRSEQTVSAAGSGIVVTAESGKRAAAGEQIAVQYNGSEAWRRAAQMQELYAHISQLTAMQTGKTRSELADESILSLSKCVTSGDLTDLYTVTLDIETYILSENGDGSDYTSELETLNASLDALTAEAAAASDTTAISAPVPGIFYEMTDGYEYISPDALEDIRVDDYDSLIGSPEADSGVIGKLVTDERWYYVTVIDEDSAAKLDSKSTVQATFSMTYSADLTMDITYISPVEDEKCVLVLSCDRYIQNVLGVRDADCEIIFSSENGIRVPRAAAHVDDDGTTYVYILEGLRAKRVDVTVLRESGDVYMVASDSALRVGDTLIVQAQNLYDGAVMENE